jgi:hypothetical protein
MLHRYRSDQALDDPLQFDEVSGRTGHPDIDQLTERLAAGWAHVLATGISDDGHELHLLVEELGDPVVITEVGSLHHAGAVSMSVAPSEATRRALPPLEVPNPKVSDPRPVPWTGVERLRGDDKAVLITFGHGTIEGLHSVDVIETSQEIAVTIRIGELPKYAGRTGFLVQPSLKVGRVRIHLEAPVAGRCLRDGASTRDGS